LATNNKKEEVEKNECSLKNCYKMCFLNKINPALNGSYLG